MIGALRRRGLRELDRRQRRAGRSPPARANQLSRLPDAIQSLLRRPALTPNTLVAELRIARQTATALLQELQAKRLVREEEISGVRHVSGAGALGCPDRDVIIDARLAVQAWLAVGIAEDGASHKGRCTSTARGLQRAPEGRSGRVAGQMDTVAGSALVQQIFCLREDGQGGNDGKGECCDRPQSL